MNKQKFIAFVENPESISGKDAEILAELAHNYPYSSLVHTLLARAKKDTVDAGESLACAAIYIPDRSVLKAVMEKKGPAAEFNNVAKAPALQASEVKEKGQTIVPEGPKSFAVDAEDNKSVKEGESPEESDVFRELQENLQKLKDQREKFENSTIPAEKTDGSQESMTNEPTLPQTNITKTFALPERLQEVVENREENVIVDPKRIEQINLIDDFIRNSQSMAKKYRSANEVPEEQPDLTGTCHFTPPDLATENLARIMMRQGKPEKAIDIYEKLVLKYPEKKAYFASCIEKLKNS